MRSIKSTTTKNVKEEIHDNMYISANKRASKSMRNHMVHG